MDRKARAAELDRKRAKVEAMRKAKKDKEEETKKGKEAAAVAAVKTAEATHLRSETEKMLEDLGIPAVGATPPAAAAATSSSAASSSSGASAPTTAESTPAQSSQQASPQKGKAPLALSKMAQTSIPPKELVTYSKEVQTTMEHSDRDVLTYGNLGHSDDEADLESGVSHHHHASSTHVMPHVENIAPPQAEQKKEEAKPPREMSDEERLQVMTTDDFMRFFDKSTRIMERALCERDEPFFIDYSGGDADQELSDLHAGEVLKLGREFYDERWSKHRTVTCMDWNTQFPELLVASYNANEDAAHEPDGVALVWNTKFKKNTPEYIFHCQSSVMSTCFAKFQPHLVVGGTYSGQIVVWDNRNNKRTPVQRTPLSAAAHTHPVYCVTVVGTQNAHNLMSISTDGKLCSWSLDMLSQPQESLELQQKQSRSAAATCMSFFAGDANNFVVGSEEGVVYTACRHGSKAGISESFEAHQGPVTGIDTHSVAGPVDLSQYFLSSSFDWTVKLWSSKETKPLYSFENNNDYVYSAKWSPTHPALFATVDGSGRLDLWNLNNDTEVPAASETPDPTVAFNTLKWHQNGGSLAVGDDIGRIRVYDVKEHLAHPRAEEWTKFVHTLQELQQEQAERADDIMTSHAPASQSSSGVGSFLGSSPMR